MKISFDLDGVIADTDKWFFRMLNVLYQLSPGNDELFTMEQDYYATRPLKYHPKYLMAQEDVGVIITARKPWAKEVTDAGLLKHGILLPVTYTDHDDLIDWTNYEKGSIIAGQYKATSITDLGVDVHFDNNPYVVMMVRKLLPNVKVILVGGERAKEIR